MIGAEGIVRVLGVGVWTQHYPNREAWQQRRAEPSQSPPRPSVLDRQCLRRASGFAKAMALAFEEASSQAKVDVGTVSTVFGSALGETGIMLRLLAQMLSGREEDFSPMLFAVSVHNAASGLVSISTDNRAFTTSMAADYDTPAMALFEAIGASFRFGTPTVLVCGDESAPDGLVGESDVFEGLSAAVVIEPGNREGPALAALEALGKEPADLAPPDLHGPLARNPQAGMLDLVDAIVRGRRGRLRLDRGKGLGWTVRIRGAG